jgi:hypothetical protein
VPESGVNRMVAKANATVKLTDEYLQQLSVREDVAA